MTARQLSVTDLPLGAVLPDHPYNLQVKRGIETLEGQKALAAHEIREIAEHRRDIWGRIQAMKDRGMEEYSRHVGRGYGLSFDDKGQLVFPWKRGGYNRIGYESDYYAGDAKTRKLRALQLDSRRPRIIVFATGRAFAERNARLRHLSAEEAMENARSIMSAQSHLVRSRLLADRGQSGGQVGALAYDMVTSEMETPAIRIENILDRTFVHPVSMSLAERIFGRLIAKADLSPRGTFVRENGRIRAQLRSDAEVLENLSALVLLGASVGCLLVLQTMVCLGRLLDELGGSPALVAEALGRILLISLGPTTHLAIDPRLNHLAVVNMFDEFVFAGHNVASRIAAAKTAGICLVPGREGEGAVTARDLTLVFDGPSTVYERPEGWVFDPDGSHFGHSLTHYCNELRDRGFGKVLERIFALSGPVHLGEVIADAEAAGEINLELDGAGPRRPRAKTGALSFLRSAE